MILTALIFPYVFWPLSEADLPRDEASRPCPAVVLAGGLGQTRLEIEESDGGLTAVAEYNADGSVRDRLVDVPFRRNSGPGGGAAPSAYGIDRQGRLVILGSMLSGRYHTVELGTDFVEHHVFAPGFEADELLRAQGTIIVSKAPSSRRFIYGDRIVHPIGVPTQFALQLGLSTGDAQQISAPPGTFDFIAAPTGDLLAWLINDDGALQLAQAAERAPLNTAPLPATTIHKAEYIALEGEDGVAVFGEDMDGATKLWIWTPERGLSPVGISSSALNLGVDTAKGRLVWVETWSGIELPPPQFEQMPWLIEALAALWSQGHRNFEISDANAAGVMIIRTERRAGAALFQAVESEQSLSPICGRQSRS